MSLENEFITEANVHAKFQVISNLITNAWGQVEVKLFHILHK